MKRPQISASDCVSLCLCACVHVCVCPDGCVSFKFLKRLIGSGGVGKDHYITVFSVIERHICAQVCLLLLLRVFVIMKIVRPASGNCLLSVCILYKLSEISTKNNIPEA